MMYQSRRALALLREGTGSTDAEFREGQEDAIRHMVEGGARLLLVQKTGWGKSFVYFIATKLLRESGTGPALLISPLLALMRNQIAAAERMGVNTVRIASDNREHWEAVEEQLRRDEVDILLVSPERFGNEHFRDVVLAKLAEHVAFLVIDEAHCISDWGHDFRPHYRLIERIVRTLPPNLRLLATTATANSRVMEDLRDVLGPNLQVQRGDLARPSLLLQTIRLPRQLERLAWLAEQIPKLAGNGIIYTLTVRHAHEVAAWLQFRGIQAEAYTGQTDRRGELEQALLDNQVKALVATTALGMGFDKPDLGFVIHYQSPASVVHYYQQVGRAGRALDAAYGVLLSGEEEARIADYFIRSAFPTPDEVRQVIDALEGAPDGLSVSELLGTVNISKGRIEKTISLLSLESPAPIVKEGGKWQLTAVNLSTDFWERAERLTRLRRDEQRQMQEYVKLESEHMEFLIRALDGDPRAVRLPNLPLLPTQPAPNLVKDAVAFLQRTSLRMEPRKRWPAGGMPQYDVRGNINIPAKHRAEPGKALCTWGDAGWGEIVKRGKYQDHQFADELVRACVNLLARWRPRPAPLWVTCIPSRRHPDLVPDFAERLAIQLGLPFHRVLHKTEDRPEQKRMANSTQQVRNVDGSLVVSGESLLHSPVLLVDDMADSRWTLTVAAWLLRSHGSGKVWPLALALTNHR
ncbi:MAG: ATP-dependent DNA helicase RecG [Candidatus Synechococcus spongiarum SP3]|uniref:DNA 3'-5' helicase n=1 Tax=Candidatus Synechococcus spongiarum SP3 TaxID=1604020 RepID=A0A0G2HMB2_9SYNE|nr:MAG: ATP-dependent DNA helicase RecG [Candidatus Synechococcus spongiarum SP3]